MISFRSFKIVVAINAAIAVLGLSSASADEALVAVATNFSNTAKLLKEDFERRSEHRITLATGSTGVLYSQITQGAPYDLFLAADESRPKLLEQSDIARAGSSFTYAIGRLTFWSTNQRDLEFDTDGYLQLGEYRSIAIANPKLAPYGLAAIEFLNAIGAQDVVDNQIVTAENVGQAYALVATKNADGGFVARSQIAKTEPHSEQRVWNIPSDMHTPIRQNAVLLKRAHSNSAAMAFFEYLKSAESQQIIFSQGYEVE